MQDRSCRTGPRHRRSAVLAAVLVTGVAHGQIPPLPTSLTADDALHVLNRLTWGAVDTDVVALTGPTSNYLSWLNAQLNPNLATDNPDVITVVTAMTPASQGQSASWRNAQAARLTRAWGSDWQLNEVMTQFWEQHFNTYGQAIRNFLIGGFGLNQTNALNTAVWFEWDDHEYYRQNALGSFRDLLRRTTLSPGMMMYLNMVQSSGCANPNENYGREFLELFTMGPINESQVPPEENYTQTDVIEVSRCFTGWGIDTSTLPWVAAFGAGNNTHCNNPKTLFAGKPYQLVVNPAGAAELDVVIDWVAGIDPTKDFICRKMIQVFLGDEADHDPQNASLLTRMKNAWGALGDIKAVANSLFRSPEFLSSNNRWCRARMPIESMAWWMRVWNGSLQDSGGAVSLPKLLRPVDGMVAIGQQPFLYPAPDGFPYESVEQPGSSVSIESYSALSEMFREHPTYTFFPTVDIAAMVQAALPQAQWNNPTQVATYLLGRLYGRYWTTTDRATVRRAITEDVNGGLRPALDYNNAADYASRVTEAAVAAATTNQALLK